MAQVFKGNTGKPDVGGRTSLEVELPDFGGSGFPVFLTEDKPRYSLVFDPSSGKYFDPSGDWP